MGYGGLTGNFFGPVNAPAPPTVAHAQLIGSVPPIADCRQEREVDLAVDVLMGGGESIVVCQVLTGLGGVGKTQLATRIAHLAWQRQQLDLLLWVNGSSRNDILTGYAQAAKAAMGVDDTDPELSARRFVAWLAQTDQRWLVVLDDLASPADLNGLWPPITATGRSIVTTRRRDAALAGSGRRFVEVGLFSREESVRYLREKLAGHPRLADGASDLAADLGDLPLALAQAAAYMADRRLSCADYLSRLADRRKRLADLTPEEEALPDEHGRAIAATWSLSIDVADTLKPAGLARPLVELASLLSPIEIPMGLFTAEAARRYLTPARDVDEDTARDAIICLHRLNLVSVAPDDRSIAIHRLIQRAVRESSARDPLPLALAAADALAEIWPDIERSPRESQMLRANAAALAANTDRLLWRYHSGVHPVLLTAGNSLGGAGLVSAALQYFRDLALTALRELGADHPDTLLIRHYTLYWQEEAGDLIGASAGAERLLSDRLRVLGSDHPDTLTTRHYLAKWTGDAGDHVAAAEAFELLLIDRVRLLGKEHLHTLATRHEMAYWHAAATGDPVGASLAYQELLSDQLRLLGPDHPDTLATRNNLALLTGQTGRSAEALAAFEELLADRTRILGEHHLHTLVSRHYCAYWRARVGDYSTAMALFEALIEDELRVLGAAHPHTLNTRRALADARGSTGEVVWAAGEYEALAAEYVQVLGPSHPETKHTQRELAIWRRRARRGGRS